MHYANFGSAVNKYNYS